MRTLDKRSYSYKRQQKAKTIAKDPIFKYLIFGILAFVVLFLFKSGKQDAFIKTYIYFIAALGFTLLLGFAGLASLGTAGFMSLGAYGIAFLIDKGNKLGLTFMASVPFIIKFIIILAIGLLLGLFVGIVSLRIHGIFLAIVTLGISEIVVEIMKNIAKMVGKIVAYRIAAGDAIGLFGSPIKQYSTSLKLVIVIVMTLAVILVFNIMRSTTGRAMLSLKNSESAGQAMGMGLIKYRLMAFLVSTFLAVLAGILYMLYLQYTDPVTDWGLNNSLLILAAVIIGGAKSIMGVFWGTFIVFAFNNVVLGNFKFFNENSDFIGIVSGIIIILIVMFYPGGLYHFGLLIKLKTKQLYQKIKTKVQSGKAKKHERIYGNDEEYPSFEAIC